MVFQGLEEGLVSTQLTANPAYQWDSSQNSQTFKKEASKKEDSKRAARGLKAFNADVSFSSALKLDL